MPIHSVESERLTTQQWKIFEKCPIHIAFMCDKDPSDSPYVRNLDILVLGAKGRYIPDNSFFFFFFHFLEKVKHYTLIWERKVYWEHKVYEVVLHMDFSILEKRVLVLNLSGNK